MIKEEWLNEVIRARLVEDHLPDDTIFLLAHPNCHLKTTLDAMGDDYPVIRLSIIPIYEIWHTTLTQPVVGILTIEVEADL